jgi:hypothetical protein
MELDSPMLVTYIASELCNYPHPLIAARDVVDVYVQHIKYRVDFFKIGFYQKNFVETWLVHGRLKW